LTETPFFLVWIDIRIRLCQFHIIQALIRWGKSKPKKAPKSGKAPPHHKLDEDALQKLLVLFRQAQRCRSLSTWKSQFLKSFNEGVDDLAAKHKCNATVIKAYFNDNWWSSWLGMTIHSIFKANLQLRPVADSTTDIGLPKDQTRDSGWNTNNPIESAFRVFDLVFLNLLQNKR
jgi:hypothetical protein